MDESRRFFLTALMPGAVFASATILGAPQLSDRPRGQFPQNPPQQTPPGIPPLPGPPTKAQLKANQKEIKKDVDELFSLAQDLKEQARKADTVDVLSVTFLEKAEQIEKLAKRIRELARS